IIPNIFEVSSAFEFVCERFTFSNIQGCHVCDWGSESLAKALETTNSTLMQLEYNDLSINDKSIDLRLKAALRRRRDGRKGGNWLYWVAAVSATAWMLL
ncbi:MAG: hypothetical protein AAF844_04020, partial [Pseudomonadota bacterium]